MKLKKVNVKIHDAGFWWPYSTSIAAYHRAGGGFCSIRKKDSYYQIVDRETCREVFHRYSFRKYTSCFGYLHEGAQNIPDFINRFEKQIGLSNKSKFYKTNYSQFILIEPSKWWKQNSLRKHLFTVLVKIGVKFNKRNFNGVLYRNRYIKHTKAALLRFINGYTIYKGYFNGWVNSLSDEKNLVKMKRS